MNLKELREKNKLTQAAFAAPLGLSRPNEKQERGRPRQRRRSTRLPRMQRRQFWILKRKSTRESGKPGPK